MSQMQTPRDPSLIIPTERFYFGEPETPEPNMPLWPGVAGVIFDAQMRILIIKRARSDYWSLPGGRIDPDESAHDCCVRETFEETGLHTRVVRLISLHTDPRRVVHYPDGNIYRSFVTCFEMEVIGGELKPSLESEAFRWIGPEDMNEVRLIPDTYQNVLDAWADLPAAFIR